MAIKKTSTRSKSAQPNKTKNPCTVPVPDLPSGEGLPPQLAAIYELLKTPPEEISFSSQEIQEIMAGKNLRCHLGTIDKGRYLNNLLVILNWWLRAVDPLLNPDLTPWTVIAVDCKEWIIKEKIERLFSLYAEAFVSRYNIEDLGSDPTGLELLKGIFEFRRYVYELVQRCFPDADLSALLKLA